MDEERIMEAFELAQEDSDAFDSLSPSAQALLYEIFALGCHSGWGYGFDDGWGVGYMRGTTHG